MASKTEIDERPNDLAARAGWMYYLGGLTQNQIAVELNVSRQRAQRLVSRAMADGLIKVRLEHPIASCLALEHDLMQRFGLQFARVAPMLPDGIDPLKSVAPLAAKLVERFISSQEPLVISLGTGRTLRAVVSEVTEMDGAAHKIVSLIGNVAPDGSASVYEVILRLADRVRTRHYPMALPVFSEDEDERNFHLGLPHIQNTLSLARNCDVTIVGVGQINETAPLYVDGFIDEKALGELIKNGAVGELVGWAYDSNGKYLTTGTNLRNNGVRVDTSKKPVICVAAGNNKYIALRAALNGKLINGLVIDESLARQLLVP